MPFRGDLSHTLETGPARKVPQTLSGAMPFCGAREHSGSPSQWDLKEAFRAHWPGVKVCESAFLFHLCFYYIVFAQQRQAVIGGQVRA